MRYLLSLFLLLAAASASAQHDHAAMHAQHDTALADTAAVPSSLSPNDLQGLLVGRGMGMAKAAEVHGFPGPMHVLELREELALTDEQAATAERLMQGVKAEARALGEQIVAAERALDEVFQQDRATPSLVRAATGEIGRLQGRLRAAHLTAHLAMRDALTPEQIARYAVLRGHTAPTD